MLRLARACTDRLCVVDTQLTRQVDPVVHGFGRTGQFHEAPASFAMQIEAGDNPLASTGHVLSLIPNRARSSR